jgi:hypothetical protein
MPKGAMSIALAAARLRRAMRDAGDGHAQVPVARASRELSTPLAAPPTDSRSHPGWRRRLPEQSRSLLGPMPHARPATAFLHAVIAAGRSRQPAVPGQRSIRVRRRRHGAAALLAHQLESAAPCQARPRPLAVPTTVVWSRCAHSVALPGLVLRPTDHGCRSPTGLDSSAPRACCRR